MLTERALLLGIRNAEHKKIAVLSRLGSVYSYKIRNKTLSAK
jgi:hypothetical protein